MRESTKTALAVLVVLAIAGAFWLLLISPKRDEANELSETKTRLSAEVASGRQQVTQALAAKQKFPEYYRQLVVLGKAVPAEAATPSLVVQLNGISSRVHTFFTSITLGGASEEGAAAAAAEGTEPLLPIGAAVGAAGLPAMPYALEFKGGFFQIADFIQGLDSLVQTKAGELDAEGRLVTIDSFTLTPPGNEEGGGRSNQSEGLNAEFQVTTYVTPPGQGLTAGATAGGPEGVAEAPPTETTP